jgi:hypothetical protein
MKTQKSLLKVETASFLNQPIREINMNEESKAILLDRDKMSQLFITEDKSLKEVAAILKVSVWSVREYLNKKHGIYKSVINPDPKQHITKQYLSNKDWLANEYLLNVL